MLVTNKKTVAALHFVERMAKLPPPPDLPPLPILFKQGVTLSDLHSALNDMIGLQKEIIHTANAILEGRVQNIAESNTKN